MNSGASLYIGGQAETMAEGIQLAAALIDSGKAMRVLDELIRLSNEEMNI